MNTFDFGVNSASLRELTWRAWVLPGLRAPEVGDRLEVELRQAGHGRLNGLCRRACDRHYRAWIASELTIVFTLPPSKSSNSRTRLSSRNSTISATMSAKAPRVMLTF